MRATWIVPVMVLLSGCAALGFGAGGPATLDVSAEHRNPTCRPDAQENFVLVHIRNIGTTPVIFPLADEGKKSPYSLYCHNIRILAEGQGGADFKWYNVVLEECVGSQRGLMLVPGETADVVELFPGWSAENATSAFEIELKDSSGRYFVSTPFRLCGSH